MNGHLLYHSNLKTSHLDGVYVYHDYPDHNQDPYLWNSEFLHTYCHMDKLRKMNPAIDINDINFWVSAGEKENRKNFTVLLCDLVFVVRHKIYWRCSNDIEDTDPLVDSKEAYIDHYKWCQEDHKYDEKHLKWGPRFTLKADPLRSFQPLNEHEQRINILDFLRREEVDEQALRKTIEGGMCSRPFRLNPATIHSLYDWLSQIAYFKRTGDTLQKLRQRYPERLSSERQKRG